MKEKLFKAIVHEPTLKGKFLFFGRLDPNDVSEFCRLHRETAEEMFEYDSIMYEVSKINRLDERWEAFKQLKPIQKVGFLFLFQDANNELNDYLQVQKRMKNISSLNRTNERSFYRSEPLKQSNINTGLKTIKLHGDQKDIAKILRPI